MLENGSSPDCVSPGVWGGFNFFYLLIFYIKMYKVKKDFLLHALSEQLAHGATDSSNLIDLDNNAVHWDATQTKVMVWQGRDKKTTGYH